MSRLRRPDLAVEATRRNQEQCARLGGEILAARRRRRWSQETLARRAGVSAMMVSRLERGRGAHASLDTWQRVLTALGIPLTVNMARDPMEEPADAGHLKVQELILRLGRATDRGRSFELPTRPADPSRSSDTGLRDDPHRTLLLVECWNTMGNIGEAARSSARKTAEAEGLAAAIGGDDGPYRIAACWVVRATRRNRELVARYPEVFAARFPGSSVGWARALSDGAPPPREPGLVWCDVAATRLFPWRRFSRSVP
jgi:transcriptional regulator with XRE-family HTH domain